VVDAGLVLISFVYYAGVVRLLPGSPDRPAQMYGPLGPRIAIADDRDRLQSDGALLSTPFDLIFPDDAFLPVHLAFDPVLEHVACLRKLLDYLVMTLAFATFAETWRKVQGLPDGKFLGCHVLLHQATRRRLRGALSLTTATRLGG
jgi:hypothetical protein